MRSATQARSHRPRRAPTIAHQLLGNPRHVTQRDAIVGSERPEAFCMKIAECSPGLSHANHVARRGGIERTTALAPSAPPQGSEVFVDSPIHSRSVVRL